MLLQNAGHEEPDGKVGQELGLEFRQNFGCDLVRELEVKFYSRLWKDCFQILGRMFFGASGAPKGRPFKEPSNEGAWNVIWFLVVCHLVLAHFSDRGRCNYVTALASDVNAFAPELGFVSEVCFDHCLAVRVLMRIVEVVVVALGWGFHFQCLWFAVLLNVVRELGHPLVFNIEVDH